jgi:hypothetical protein
MVLTGAGLTAMQNSSAKAPPPVAPAAQAAALAEPIETFKQRVVLTVVSPEEMEAAIKDFPTGVQPKIRKDVAAGKYGLLWLTAWDWDTAPGEDANTISVVSNGYRRFIQLTEHRNRFAVPDPASGSIELRGEVTEDGNISISVLSGTQPIVLPQMVPGKTIRLVIDKQDTKAVPVQVSEPADRSINRYQTE